MIDQNCYYCTSFEKLKINKPPNPRPESLSGKIYSCKEHKPLAREMISPVEAYNNTYRSGNK